MSNYSEILDGIAEIQNQRLAEEKRQSTLTEVEKLQEKLEKQQKDVLETKQKIAEAKRRK